MLPASHSLLFRVHTRVFVTLLIALAVTSLLWARPAAPAGSDEHRAASYVSSLP